MPHLDSMQQLDEVAWRERVNGWMIVGCSLRRGPVLSLVMRKKMDEDARAGLWDAQVPTRVFYFNLATGVSGYDQFEVGMGFPKIGSSELPESLTLCGTRDRVGSVFAANRDYAEMEEVAPEGRDDGSKSFRVMRIARIDGWAYAVGMFRKIAKRNGRGNWSRINAGMPPLTPKLIDSGVTGFEDLHGLSESNMYAVGGKGDVWRYDGSQWRQCDFPSNQQLGTVTVAPDGQVYISGEGGSLWVGREDTWTLLHRGYSSVLFDHSRWFNGQLWLASTMQLRVWDGNELRPPQHEGVRVVHTGHMDCQDGLLVIAGEHSVHLFDGNQWRTVIRPYK
jgi:hypothetical protein